MKHGFSRVALLALLPAWSFAASFNGIDLNDYSAAHRSERRQPVVGEVAILPGGALGLQKSLARGTSMGAALASQGVTLIGSIGPDAALVRCDADASPLIAALAPLSADGKYEPAVRDLLAGIRAGSVTDPDLGFYVHSVGDTRVIVDSAATKSGVVVSASERLGQGVATRVALTVSTKDAPAFLAELAANPQVFRIERGGGAKLLLLPPQRRIVQSGTNTTGGETIWAHGIRGEGQILAVLDTGADPLNCYLSETDGAFPPVTEGLGAATSDLTRRKIVAYDMLYSGDTAAVGLSAYENQGHGTHVSGNALGSKFDDPFSTDDAIPTGVAPGAKLVMQDGGYTTLDDCSDLVSLGCPLSIDMDAVLTQAYTQGARLHNNSWGDRENLPPYNTYTPTCHDFDMFSWTHDDFLIVCAAGNSGGEGLDTVCSPSVSKNVVSVAATANPDFTTIVGFSSRGFAEDGRFKPDLAVPGQTTASTWGSGSPGTHCSTGDLQGTSMASPTAMGSIALVRQYFTEGWYPTGTKVPTDAMAAPSAALLKATTLNGCTQTGPTTPPPSRGQGWGRVLLDNSLYFDGEARKLLALDRPVTFASAADTPYEVRISSNGNSAGGNIVVTLVWTDYPAISGANPTIVNDLDLTVIDSSNVSYLGNELSTVNGLTIPGGTRDNINTVEMVKLAPTAGDFTIRVTPTAIPQPGQTFALVVGGDVQLAGPSSIDNWLAF